MDCIFCKIINGEIPCEKIYEDEKIIAFLDIRPVTKGHTLLLCKEHQENFLALPDDLIGYLFQMTKKIAPAVVKGSDANGFNIGINNGQVAGQIIPHFHLHLIPRYSDDGLVHWSGQQYQEGEMEKYGEGIRKELKIKD